MSSLLGYYRQPTLFHDRVVFVADDDLWCVPASGGPAQRLTSNQAECARPLFSPDGKTVAFIGREEGPSELYAMPADGGMAKRISYLGSSTLLCCWSPDGGSVIVASNVVQPFPRLHDLYRVPLDGGPPEPLNLGHATSFAFGPTGGRVLGRHGHDPARWKRYRGGMAGVLWIDPDGSNRWRKLIDLDGNLSRPMWLGDRIYFLADHEGVGNIYSCTPAGDDLRRETDHAEFYARQPSSDGSRIVYHCGADLWLLDPASSESRKIEIDFPSPRVQQQRKFVSAGRHLEDYQLHPQGHSIATVVRGKVFSMGLWEGPATSIGDADGVRKRLARWLPDGKRLVFVSDAGGEERLEVHSLDPLVDPIRFDEFDVGRAIDVEVAPKDDAIVLSNHRLELVYVHLGRREMRVLDKSPIERISGMAWSPDGRWVAYGFRAAQSSTAIKLCRIETGETHVLCEPVLYDVAPRFDPDGKYLFFLSYRQFDPVYDNLQFDLGFPRGVRPMMVTLRKDQPSPLTPTPRAPGDKPKYDPPPVEKNTPKPHADDSKNGAEAKSSAEAKPAGESKPASDADSTPVVQIDLDGIADRIQSLPVPDARYVQIEAIRGKVLFLALPIEGRLSAASGANAAVGVLEAFNLDELEKETLSASVTDFMVSANHKIMAIRSGQRLRVLKAGDKPDDSKGADANRKTGWLDLRRLKVSIMPAIERAQMFREAWRLQRDHFWAADMSGVDWELIYRRYEPLIARVSTRSEFSDLLWELHGELGTSHAYEMGGDYRPEPRYDQGFLGADLEFDSASSGWRIARIIHGDSWDKGRGSPLLEPGLNVKVGDLLIAVNGRRLSREVSPAVCLVHQADSDVTLTFLQEEPASAAKPEPAPAPSADAARSIETPAPNEALSSKNVSGPDGTTADAAAAPSETPGDSRDAGATAAAPASPSAPSGEGAPPSAGPATTPGTPRPKTRTISVRALRDDRGARYRDWVEGNRKRVHELSDGKVGYIHVPDMGPRGFAEFHRYYLAEFDRPALLVDVRCNGGGHVSGLLLEKLARRRIGWCHPRWGRPRPYPDSAPRGPMLALTNEVAGSDGDIFSHSFQMMGLGPLVGTRTWGGVIGIWVRHSLVDGTVTTQPEFSYWFANRGWGVENHGATPDVVLEIAPHDAHAGRDPQLDGAIQMLLDALRDAPAAPSFEAPPSRALPSLPPRNGRAGVGSSAAASVRNGDDA